MMDIFQLTELVLGAPLFLGYALPLLTVAMVMPLLGRRSTWATTLLVVTISCAGGAVMALVGGAHRRRMETGGPTWSAFVAAAVTLAVLSLGPVAATVMLRLRHARSSTQRLVALVAAIAVIVIASPWLVLVISCGLSGECM
jgi:hypothetical protein